MKISLNLLRTIIDCAWSHEKIAEKLTMSGSEVEAVEIKGEDISGVIGARVISKESLAGSDKLSLCQIDSGKEKLQVVCGAPNISRDQVVLFAPLGSKLPGGVKIDKAIIQGVESYGMILSETELDLSQEAATIAVLPADVRPGTPLDKIVNYKDVIFELEITPNRPDCLSHIGIARELQALGGGKVRFPDIDFPEIVEQAKDRVQINITDPDGCPRYTGRVISDVRIENSPLWLKMMVHYLGMRPINNIVDITNYVMLELGQPLHAFDFDLFNKPEIRVRRASEGEKFTTLDQIKRTLGSKHLLITDGVKPVAIAGIMGGVDSEVSDHTKNILLESAYFDPVVIRRGSKKLGLSSESSRRFERGVDWNMVPKANDRACKLISDIARGKVHKGMVDANPRPFIPIQIELRPGRAEHVLGAKIGHDEIMRILTGLEIKCASRHDKINVEQPSFRPDLTREADLIEEIARIYGFDLIPPRFRPGGDLATPMTKLQRIREKTRSYLTGAGVTEIFPITLADSRLAEKLGLIENCVRLINPLSEEMSIFRPNLIITMLPVIRRNINFREKNLALFEIGDICQPQEKGKLPGQRTNLAIAICGMELPDFWDMKWHQRDLFSLKGMLEDLADNLKVRQLNLEPAPHFIFEKDHSFDVYFDGRKMGMMGKLSGFACEAAEIKEPIFMAEIDFETLVEVIPDTIIAKDLAKFPSADRDIAIVIDENIMANEIREEIVKSGAGLVDDTWIFDLYRGKNIPPGKKSLAFGIKYRLAERTLTDEEVNQAQDNIIEALRSRFAAELRK